MDIHNIRLQLRQKTIYELQLRVTFYARVSTDSNEQLNSLTNQITYYEEMIKKIPPGPMSLAISTKDYLASPQRNEKTFTG